MMKGIGSIKLIPHFVLHLTVGEVVPGYLSGQEDHHHIKSSIISVELTSSLNRSLPVLQTLVEVVLAELLTDLLQL